MKRWIFFGMFAALATACGVAPDAPNKVAANVARVSTQAIAASYTLTDLNPLTPIGTFKAISFDSKGLILGNLDVVTNPPFYGTIHTPTPYTYDPVTGTLSNLSVLIDGRSLLAASVINVGGQVGGQVSTPSGSVYAVSPNAFVRNPDGTVVDFGVPGSGNSISCNYMQALVNAMNDAGQVLITSIASTTSVHTCATSFVGSVGGGTLQPIGSLGGSTTTWDITKGYDINTSGVIVGTSALVQSYWPGEYRHAFVTTPTGIKDLNKVTGMPELPLSTVLGSTSTADASNDGGLAVGEYAIAMTPGVRGNGYGYPIMHPAIWNTNTDTYIDLGNNSLYGSLYDINTSGQVVGKAYNTRPTTNIISNVYAVVGDATGLKDLNMLVPGLPTGWKMITANKINDAGQILATATDAAAVTHSVLLNPSTTIIVLPAVPSNLNATTISSTQINLTWVDNATDETAQYLERCAGAGCTNFVQVASVAANVTNYSDTGLTAATSYSYRVRAHNASGDSAFSSVATASTPVVVVPTAPVAPSNLVAGNVTRNSVVLNWTDNSSNESNFLIERCRGQGCSSFTQIASVAANTTLFTDSGLRNATSYSYRVRASNTIGNSAYSNKLTIKTLQ
jgi:Fibronectin type III domain